MKKSYSLFVSFALAYLCGYSQPVAQWVRNYNDPVNGIDIAHAIALDNSCNLYVTGQSDSITTGADYLTVKYDYQGNVLWKVRYNGPANGDDIPSMIKVDNSGNVYVTGKSQGTGWDYATVKYNSNGVEQWAKRFNNANPGGNGDDVANDLALSPSGNAIYVTGYSHNYVSSTSNNNWVTIAYNTAGVQQWLQSYAFLSTPDEAFKILVSGSGNIYVLGTRDYEPYVKEYNSSGTQVHEAYGCGGGYQNIPTGLLLDGSDNIYMLDHGIGNLLEHNIYLAKSDQNGFGQWCKVYDGIPTDFKIDPSGNFYISGYTSDTSNHDMLVMKCNSSGDTVWTKTFNGVGVDGDDRAIAIALDNTSSHNIIITGYETNGSGTKDMVILKLNGNTGAIMWQTQYDQGCSNDDAPSAMLLDGFNNIHIGGYSYCNNSLEDFTTIKYVANSVTATASGNQTICNGDTITISASGGTTYQWFSGTNSVGTSQTVQVSPSTMSTYSVIANQYCWSDTAYVIINVNPNPPSPTITQIGNSLQSSSASTYQWYLNGAIINGATSQIFLISQSGIYSVVITDATGCSGTSSLTVGIPEVELKNLISVFPNPATEKVCISGQLLRGTSITISNILGENLYTTLLVKREEKFEIDIHSFHKGIYFVEINTEERKQMQKLIINQP